MMAEQAQNPINTQAAQQLVKDVVAQVGDKNIDWESRLKLMKGLSVLCGDKRYHATICQQLPQLSLALQSAAVDPRFKLAVGACDSIRAVLWALEEQADLFTMGLVKTLCNILVSSAKVVKTDALRTIMCIYEKVPSPRLMNELEEQVKSTSKNVRNAAADAIGVILGCWPRKAIEIKSDSIIRTLDKLVIDKDSDTKVSSQSAFDCFVEKYGDLLTCGRRNLDFEARRRLEALMSKKRSALSTVNASTGSAASKIEPVVVKNGN